MIFISKIDLFEIIISNPLNMKRFSVFTQLYNALRVLLHDSAILLQQSDFTDEDEAAMVLFRMKSVIDFCESHMEIENKFIYPFFADNHLALPDNHQENREACIALVHRLRQLINNCENCITGNEKNNFPEEFIRHFTRLLLINLQFSEQKETILNRELSIKYTPDELVSVRNNFISSVPLDKRDFFYKCLFSAMNNGEVICWLQEAKVNASGENFQSLLMAAEQTIPTQHWQKIQNAIIEGELLA